MPPTIDRLLRDAARALAATSDTARLDAETLLAHALGRDRAWLRAHADDTPDEAGAAAFASLLARRAAGVPVAYLTGRREFWSLALEVTPATLIPRPDTETLVQAALDRLPAAADAAVLDLGTGTGAVALAIARERPRARVAAVERDPAALEVARRNAARLGLAVELLHGDWFAPVTGRRFDLVVSNPPYVAEGDPHLERGDVRHEPRMALAAGRDGLAALRVIARDAPAHLLSGGWLVCEHGAEQGPAVRTLFATAGLAGPTTAEDLGGRPRVTAGRMAP
jgi:release factor glutamine methyltransferase